MASYDNNSSKKSLIDKLGSKQLIIGGVLACGLLYGGCRMSLDRLSNATGNLKGIFTPEQDNSLEDAYLSAMASYDRRQKRLERIRDKLVRQNSRYVSRGIEEAIEGIAESSQFERKPRSTRAVRSRWHSHNQKIDNFEDVLNGVSDEVEGATKNFIKGGYNTGMAKDINSQLNTINDNRQECSSLYEQALGTSEEIDDVILIARLKAIANSNRPETIQLN